MEQQHHFFGSTSIGWATANTREAVLKKLARDAGADIIKRNRLEHGGLYCWTCRVEVPQASSYSIERFAPAGVPTSEMQQFRIITSKGDFVVVHEE